MKKILLFCLAFAALSFTSCDKETEENGYTLTITPAEVTIGDDITLTITGPGASDKSWTACYTNTTTGKGNCLMPQFVNGVATVTTNANNFEAGVYDFNAHDLDDSTIETSHAKVTLK